MTTPAPDEEAIFHAARRIGDPDARREYVRRASGGDEALAGRVEGLLAVHDDPGSFLREPLGRGGPEAGATTTGPTEPDAAEPLDFLAPSDEPGSLGRLGHYEVREVVGRGGMGVVLKAFDETLHRVVAIKVMAPQLATSATARKRFTREARAAAAVTHDHVVTIHAVEESGPLPHIVMQYVAGASLQDRLDRTGPLQLQEVLRIGMQTASGLAAAHAQGLVHRDVKPANILLENGVERVKLTDFGLARAADDASLTQSGAVAGTPQYMSPEQAEGMPVDHRSDLFSLGSVLYAMCAGRPPFRASTSMGVLKRVCEDTPSPLREANPEVPDWLADLIGRLHAKDPAGRFQSAAEVADVLARHLAHVQHPSAVPLPAVAKSAEPTPAPARPERRKRSVAATAVLVATLAVLGTTEATGVTNFRAAVIRIFTSEGTLVVETDDPGVKVVVEGDGDLVITGAGPQEVRLRAGSYKLHAVKDGKPVKLDRDLVNITRGDRQIVRVRLEEEQAPTAVAPKAGSGAFVVLGGKGVAERKFDTLAEAVQHASDGDTVEVRGNGPFDCGPVRATYSLTIRAAEGFRPVLRFRGNISTNRPLVLGGLELQAVGDKTAPGHDGALVNHSGDSLHLANCRFREHRTNLPCVVTRTRDLFVRNCEFLCSNQSAITGHVPPGKRWVIENCVAMGVDAGILQFYHPIGPVESDSFIRLRHNTVVAGYALGFFVDAGQQDALGEGHRISVEAADNVFDVAETLFFVVDGKTLPPKEVESLLRLKLDWHEGRNLFAPGACAIRAHAPGEKEGFWLSPQNLRDWKKFWRLNEAGSAEVRPKYHGGNVCDRVVAAPDKITAADFRLRPDSAGYRAGKDGKDLGADVDLVGPGPAYDRWKKTPAYQQWLKDTGQVKK